MYLNWGFIQLQLRNQSREKIKITQRQPRLVLKASINFKFAIAVI